MTNEEFVEMANPFGWYIVAENLHEQAVDLRTNAGGGELTRVDYTTGKRVSWDNTNRATYLLASFALENALKAFLVYENPGWISNGKLSRHLRSHELTTLASMSNHVPYKKRGNLILKAFEEGNQSWARYPCALNKEQTEDQGHLNDSLWHKYEWLIGSYGRKLVKLLSINWKGPHGFHGRYEIKGNFLGIKV